MHMRAGCLRAVTVLVAACALGGLAACAPGAAGGSGAGSTAGSAQAAGSDEIVYVPTVNGGGEDSPEPSATETASSEQGAHDFECEWFYVDVPDSWVRDDSGRTPSEGDPPIWYVKQTSDTTFEFHYTKWIGGYNEYESGMDSVTIGGSGGTSTDGYTHVGTTYDGRDVWMFGVSAGFFAIDGHFEGDTFVTEANGITDPNRATITLKTSGSASSASQAPAQSDDEAAFVATARAALKVPDDPSITYEIGEPSYWEGAGVYVTRIYFYQNGEVVAGALCSDDGSPARDILVYTAP